MRLAPIFFVLCLFCLSKGAPPTEDGTSSKTGRFRYTNEEDEFIIQQLLHIPGDNVRISSKALWENIEEEHRKKWKEGASGFPCERTFESLRKRLLEVLIHNYSHVKVKVPETLTQKFPLLDYKKPKRASRPAYTPEEEKLIIQELSKPLKTTIYGDQTWAAVKIKHDAKRKAGCHGFRHERTSGSLRSHMDTMRRGGQLPNEVLKKISLNQEAGSSSSPVAAEPTRGTSEAQETNEYSDEDAWAISIIQEPDDDVSAKLSKNVQASNLSSLEKHLKFISCPNNMQQIELSRRSVELAITGVYRV